MALPVPPPYSDPIPNNPFYSPESYLIRSDYYNMVVGTGLSVSSTGVISSTGGGGAVASIIAGTGISVSSPTGNVTVTNAGVTSLLAGSGISLSGGTGAVTITNLNSGTVTAVNTGAGLTGGPITTSGTVALTNTGVVAGSYSYPTLSIDAQGRITSATSGTAITALSVTAPITSTGGSSPTIGINAATTAACGAVQLSDSVAITDSTLAATSTAVKTAYDLANAAIPRACLTAKGDLITATGPSTVLSLTVGADGEVLTADSTSPGGLKWAVAGGSVPPATPTVEGIVFACTAIAGEKTYLGQSSGVSNTGNYNTLIGYCAGASCTTYSTVAVGNAAGRDAGGSYNTFVGSGAGLNLTTGSDNVAVGVGSLQTPGGGNGSCNVAVGCNTLRSIDATGSNLNVALGHLAGSSLTAGSRNVLIGPQVQAPVATGSCQLAIGFNSGVCWLTGCSDQSIRPARGIRDGLDSTGTAGQVLCSDGNNRVFWTTPPAGPYATPLAAGTVFACSCYSTPVTIFGYNSGVALTTGIYNTIVGSASSTGLTTGNYNTIVGNYAVGSGATSASCNVAIGECNLSQLTTGGNNITIGFKVASDPVNGISSGCNNVLIGSGINTAAGTTSCTLAIGYGPTFCWLTGDNSLAIKPGAGIIDCTGSCGTAGQILSSTGTNAIEWITSGGGASDATPTIAGILKGCTDNLIYNTFLGCNAGVAGGASGSNTAVGFDALTASTGGYNTAVGFRALTASTTGIYNTAVGWCSLASASSSGSNTAVGCSSLLSLTIGNGNTSLGARSGESLTSGNSNTFVGEFAGNNVSTGSFNTAIGCGVQIANAAGDCQLAIGFDSTSCWLYGNSTKAVGFGAGIIDCAGSCGTAGQVLSSTGTNSVQWVAAGGASPATPTAFGTVKGCITATYSALGCNALLNNTGPSNAALGNNALCTNTSGAANTAVGNNALRANTTASGNSAFGSGALLGNTTGVSNTAVGSGALAAITTTSQNTAVGNSALSTSTGGCNTALGGGALLASTTGVRNVAIGFQAGANLTTGSCNVIIGAVTDVLAAAGDCQLAIGFGAGLWLSGNSTKAIKPGGGVIDCANSCGTANMVLTSQGNAVEWKTVSSAIAAPNYGSFYHTLTQTNTTPSSGIPVLLNTTDVANNFSIISGSRVTAAVAGTYNLQFSIQMETTTASLQTVEIWLVKNGTAVPSSNTKFITKGSGEAAFAALNYVVQLTAGQYAELYWASSDTNMTLAALTSSYGGPAIPSAIVTIVPVGA